MHQTSLSALGIYLDCHELIHHSIYGIIFYKQDFQLEILLASSHKDFANPPVGLKVRYRNTVNYGTYN